MRDLELEVHFHDPEHASVILTSALLGVEEMDAKLMLFSLFACRQLMNIGASDTADSLAALLRHCGPEELASLADHDGANGPSLVVYQGAPGRVRFSAGLSTDPMRFTANSKGMGALAKGAGYYSPNSVLLLLRHLAKQFQNHPIYLERLALAAQAVGQAHDSGQLTLRSQGHVAMLAVGWAMSEVERDDTEDSFAGPPEVPTDAPSVSNHRVAEINELELVASVIAESTARSEASDVVERGRVYELAPAIALDDYPREIGHLDGGTALEQAAPPRSMFCMECGTSLPQVAKFCLSCGIPVVSPSPLGEEPVSEDSIRFQEAIDAHDDLVQVQQQDEALESTTGSAGDLLGISAESLSTSDAKPVNTGQLTEPAWTPASGGWHAPARADVGRSGGWRAAACDSGGPTIVQPPTHEESGTLQAPVSKKTPWGLIAVCVVALAVIGLALAASSDQPSGSDSVLGVTAPLSLEDRAIITGLETFSSRWNSTAAPVISDYNDSTVSADDWVTASRPVIDSLRDTIDGFEADVSRISNDGVRNVLLELNGNYTDKFNGIVDLFNAVLAGDQAAETGAVGDIKAAAEEGQRLALGLKDNMRPFVTDEDLNSLF
jgi:hypothetical protein